LEAGIPGSILVEDVPEDREATPCHRSRSKEIARTDPCWSLLGRLHYSLVALSTLTIVSLLAYYNLIGYQF
jgi:hypothetical protein